MELKDDVTFCFDGFVIDQCGLVAPFGKRLGDGRDQIARAKDESDVFDVAILRDSGANADGTAPRGNLRRLRIDARN